LVHSFPCSLYGKYKSSPKSVGQIEEFVKEFNIDTSEFLPLETYKSFNEFFARSFLDGKRKWSKDKKVLSAFCEGRYLLADSKNPVHLKGSNISPIDLLGQKYGEEFKDSTALICRLAPVDYHWFHFPDDGDLNESYGFNGPLNSVTPISLRARANVLNSNKRVVNILNCENLGEVAYVEIGAFCVGTIKQTYTTSQFYKGQEKGHFLFGGSTVVLLIKDKNIEFNKELLRYSKEGIETYFKLGTDIGRILE
jgi:phosphatidylserine decarboxylase